jgi:FtsP/CotA-like multicopper oxidase with cupredoxin domain
VITVLSILSAATGAVALASSTGTLNAPPAAADQEDGMVAGALFQDPPDAEAATSADGLLTVTLDAHDAQFDLAGKTVRGQSYHGSYIAPTIRFSPGSHVDVRLVNHLPVAAGVRFHGLHVDPASHADDDSLCIAPGATYTYHLVIPADHPQGTYWYHSQAMGPACSDGASEAVAGADGSIRGLSGALIVGDDSTLLPAAYQTIATHTLVLEDVQLGSSAPTIRLVNGQLRPVLTMHPDETQLWRLINAGDDLFYRLRLDGYTFTVVGEDGVPVAGVTTTDMLVLPPGKRFDVLVTATSTPGDSWLRTTAYSTGPQGDHYPDTTLAQLSVYGNAVSRLPALTGAVRTAPPSLADATIAQQRTLDLSESPDGLAFFINGKQADPHASVFPDPGHTGTVEEWTILNESGEDHPFSLETTDFQEMSVNGTSVPYTHRQAVVPVPHAVSGVPGKVVIRIPIDGYPVR